jgi:hypothetical protein
MPLKKLKVMKCLSENNIWVFLGLLLINSCAPIGNIAVNNVNDSGSLQAGSFIYALPQTVIDVYVTAEEVTLIPGPYEKFAEKYLGIQNAPANAEKIWNIKSISLKKHTEADPEFIYTLNGTGDPDTYPVLAMLMKDSLVLGPKDFSHDEVHHYVYPPKTNELLYTDLSIKRNFEAEKDIEVSLVMPDTNYQAKPAFKNLLKEKTIEQKAEEAANFIIKLKKRRFKLVAGQYDNMPEGEAMGEALKELSRIEAEYLSLFIGKRILTEVKRSFHYTPVAGKETDWVVLFRFSPDTGLIDARETGGIPVMLEIKADHKTKGLEQYRMPLKPAANIIHYRIADQVTLKLNAGELVWAEANYPIFQWGAMVPVNIVK